MDLATDFMLINGKRDFKVRDYLFEATKYIAEKNEVKTLKLRERKYLKEDFKSIIEKFSNPVIITNITVDVLLETAFQKIFIENEKDKTFPIFKIDDEHTFELFVNPNLNGITTEMIIFENGSFDNATIVNVDISNV